MKIAILSDSHDHVPLLRAAGAAAKAYGAEAILHCGDVVAPSTLNKLQEFGLPVHAIHGNNAGDTYMLSHIANKEDSVITYYGQDASIQLGGRRIFLVHYPHYANAMALTGEYDLLCCGHTHRHGISHIKTIKGGEAVVCNPGTIGGVAAPATFMLGDLDDLKFTLQTIDKITAKLI